MAKQTMKDFKLLPGRWIATFIGGNVTFLVLLAMQRWVEAVLVAVLLALAGIRLTLQGY
ncbi:hypothetical protein LCGC14_2187900, partial [marine sediment metagenome]